MSKINKVIKNMLQAYHPRNSGNHITPPKPSPFSFRFIGGDPNPFVDMRHERDPAKIADALLDRGSQVCSRVEAYKRVTNLLYSSDTSLRTIGIKALKIFLQRGGQLDSSCKPAFQLLHAFETNIERRNEIEEIWRIANTPLTIC